MIYIGVDPGKDGAIATINSDNMEIEIQPMPIIKGKGRSQYNLVEIKNVLCLLPGYADTYPPHILVTVEKLQPLPPKMKSGSIANYHRGVASGWSWLLTGMSIPHQLARPQDWQKVMLAGTPGTDTKQRSIIAAQRLFPGQSLKRTEKCRKPDAGMSDALLICAYGMRTCGK